MYVGNTLIPLDVWKYCTYNTIIELGKSTAICQYLRMYVRMYVSIFSYQLSILFTNPNSPNIFPHQFFRDEPIHHTT